MKKLLIDVFENGQHETTIKIPLAVLKFASRLLPSEFLASMNRHSVSMNDLMEAASHPDASGTLVEIEEHTDKERVVISVA